MSDLIPIVAIISGTVMVLTVLRLIAGAVTRRQIAHTAYSDPELAARVERIEQIVEATAIEVERITESSRFMARLLAEKSSTATAKELDAS
jgi:outer membrane murein-binding lipoprotein Lpp